MTKLYYIAPSDTSFDEMKKACTEVWNEKDNTYGYVDEKIGQIKDIKNVQDNFMYMFSMFDAGNMRKVADKLSVETKKEVRERMVDGGNDDYYITSLGL